LRAGQLVIGPPKLASSPEGSFRCLKTFNTLTGTPLAKLHHRDKWFAYLGCMLDSLTLRITAKRLGIDLKTAFRWRHRFLASAAKTNANALSGIIEVDETWFLESCKGKRRLTHRMTRKRDGQGSKKKKADKCSASTILSGRSS